MTTEPQADIVERLARTIPVVDGTGRVVDGLVNPDGREAAAEITRLRTELAEARLQGRREGLESVVAWLRVLETAELTPPILAFFGDPWGDDGQRLCGEIASAIEREDPATLLKDSDHG